MVQVGLVRAIVFAFLEAIGVNKFQWNKCYSTLKRMQALHYCLCLILFTTFFILHYLAADQVFHYEPLTLAIRKDALRM